MSATLTTKRKSALDRPRPVVREGGEGGRESGGSTEELEAGRRRVTFAEMTSTSERALAAAQLRRSKIALPLAPIVSSPARFDLRQSSVRRPRQLLPPASLLLPPAPPPSGLTHPADILSLSCSRRPSVSRAAIDATPVCRERARMREIEGKRAGCVARTTETPSTNLAAAAPAALVAWPKSIDVPLSGPKRQTSSEKGRARSTHGAGGHQTLPAPRPIVAALAHAPDRSSAWSRVALPYTGDVLNNAEKGTMLKPWGAAMIKSKTMGMMPRRGAIQWCRLRRVLPSRSLAPARGTKGGGLATAILNHLT